MPPSLSAPLAGLRRASPRRAGRPRESSATRLPLRLPQINTHSKHRIYRAGRYRRFHAIRWATSTGTLQVCASARGGPYTIGMKISKPHTSGHCLNRTRRGLRPCGTPTLSQYHVTSPLFRFSRVPAEASGCFLCLFLFFLGIKERFSLIVPQSLSLLRGLEGRGHCGPYFTDGISR